MNKHVVVVLLSVMSFIGMQGMELPRNEQGEVDTFQQALIKRTLKSGPQFGRFNFDLDRVKKALQSENFDQKSIKYVINCPVCLEKKWWHEYLKDAIFKCKLKRHYVCKICTDGVFKTCADDIRTGRVSLDMRPSCAVCRAKLSDNAHEQ